MLVLLLALATVSIAAAEDGHSYGLMLTFDKKEFTPISLDMIASPAPNHNSQPEDGYIAKVISFSGEELYSYRFAASFHVYDYPDYEEPDEIPVLLSFPYFGNAEMLQVYSQDGKRLMLEVDLSDYAICNEDGRCDKAEKAGYCSTDCTEGGLSVEEEPAGTEAPVEGEGSDKGGLGESWPYTVALIIAVIIAIILVFKAKKKR